jgi:ATP-dependent DNA ligase
VKLPVPVALEPMEAELRRSLPDEGDWLFEPKWDGFRCLAFRDGEEVELRSKAGKPLGRYFPDVVEAMLALPARRFVLDGEIVISTKHGLDFDELLLRIHPAATRVEKLAAANPATVIVFDLLVDERGTDWTARPLKSRRRRLETFARSRLEAHRRVLLSPATTDLDAARAWLDQAHGGLDGVVAKRLDLPYQAGTRAGMVKVKRLRSADCVIGGFRWSRAGGSVGSLLLGLHDDEGRLNHVGFCSAFDRRKRAEVDERIPALRGGAGFTGRAPTEQSRWRKEGSGDWEPVEPTVVVEVEYDHFSGGRFRHGTRFVRWRPDKAPEQCTMGQVEREARSALSLI